MSLVFRRLRKSDCHGYAEYSKSYVCDQPISHDKYCEDHIPYLMRRKRDYDNTPQETRQKYLDALHDGKNIGEARKIAGISLDVAMEITDAAISSFMYLEKRAK